MNLGHLRIAIWRGPNTPAGIRQEPANPALFAMASWSGAGTSTIKTQGVRGPSCGRSASPSWRS